MLNSASTSYASLSPRRVLMLASLLLPFFVAQANGQPTGHEPYLQAKPLSSAKEASSSDRFTGSLTVRQKGASLHYKIYIVRGAVIGGYDTWRGRSTHYHRIVGGWYDGERMVLLIQSTQDDFGDKWYSHAHHFEKKGDEFVIKHTLYGFGKTIDSGEVYTPHTIDEVSELPADQVRRMAATADPDSSAPTKPDTEHATLTKRTRQLDRENARLKELVAELVLEKTRLQRKLRDK